MKTAKKIIITNEWMKYSFNTRSGVYFFSSKLYPVEKLESVLVLFELISENEFSVLNVLLYNKFFEVFLSSTLSDLIWVSSAMLL